MVAKPLDTTIDHLRWFFLLYASKGILEWSIRVPAIPWQVELRRYDAAVAKARQAAMKEEARLLKEEYLWTRIPVEYVPFPDLNDAEALPPKSLVYPVLGMPTLEVPVLIALVCGTELDRQAANHTVRAPACPCVLLPVQLTHCVRGAAGVDHDVASLL